MFDTLQAEASFAAYKQRVNEALTWSEMAIVDEARWISLKSVRRSHSGIPAFAARLCELAGRGLIRLSQKLNPSPENFSRRSHGYAYSGR